MNENKQIRLTSAEISQLWAQYMNDSASICMLTFFLEKAEDAEIKAVIEHALQLSKSHIQKATAFFTKENNAIPYGFKLEEDVNFSAPRLFSDDYVLNFIQQMSKIGLTSYSASLSSSVRSDITLFYMDCLTETMQLYKLSKDLLLEKGLYVRSPYLPTQEKIEFVEKQSFIWDGFGDKRPLVGVEIANLYANIQRNALGAATLIGFSQVAEKKEVNQFFIKGFNIAKKHVRLFGTKLEESNLNVPMTWATEVTESTTFTFSDKLMMFCVSALNALGIGYYGASISQCPRIDLGVMFNRLSLEVQMLSEDAANIMIKNRWLEKPPIASDRKGLADRSHS